MEVHKIIHEIGVEDFIHAFERTPLNKDEFMKFCHFCEKGLEAQIDWTVVVNCAKEEMVK